MVTEKGEDYGRIHLHGIVWCPKERVDMIGKEILKKAKEKKIWQR